MLQQVAGLICMVRMCESRLWLLVYSTWIRMQMARRMCACEICVSWHCDELESILLFYISYW